MRAFFAVGLTICFVPFLQSAEKENPFKNAAVGDWVEYKMSGENIAGKTKMTIVAKDDKEVTYEVAATFSFKGNETTAPIQKVKVDLTKSYDPISSANLKKNDVKLEKVDEGKEKVKVGDKELDTIWTKTKSTATTNGFTVESEYKMWFSKDVPVSGLVKMETTVANMTITLELVAFGKK